MTKKPLRVLHSDSCAKAAVAQMTHARLALLSALACASAFSPAAPGALRPRNFEPLCTVTAANRIGTLLSESLRKPCAVRASVAATVPGGTEWREGVYWEWRGMKVRYAVMNPQGQRAPLLLVHGGSWSPSSSAPQCFARCGRLCADPRIEHGKHSELENCSLKREMLANGKHARVRNMPVLHQWATLCDWRWLGCTPIAEGCPTAGLPHR